MEEEIRRQLDACVSVQRRIAATMLPQIEDAARRLIACYERDGKVLLCGNGGSAADAQHLAGELVGRFRRERRAVSAIALTTDTSVLTAIGNDYGYDEIFARQVRAHGRAGDVLIGLSTSGNSANVIAAVRIARECDLTTIALTGCGGGQLAALCDVSLIVPSDDTPRIQEAHIIIGHILCDLVERTL